MSWSACITLLIIIHLFTFISPQKYQLFEVASVQNLLFEKSARNYISSQCSLQYKKLLHLILYHEDPQTAVFQYNLYRCNLKDYDLIFCQLKRIKSLNNQILDFYWKKIGDQMDYLTFVFEDRICVERLSIILASKEQYYPLCNKTQSTVYNDYIGSPPVLQIVQKHNFIKIYVFLQKIHTLIQFIIDSDANITTGKNMTQIMKCSSMELYKDYICLIVNQKASKIIYFYSFQDKPAMNISITVPNSFLIFWKDMIILYQKNADGYIKKVFNYSLKQGSVKEDINEIKFNELTLLNDILYSVGSNWISETSVSQPQLSQYINMFTILDNVITPYQLFPTGYFVNSYGYLCSDGNLSIIYSPQQIVTFSSIEPIQILDSVNTYIYALFTIILTLLSLLSVIYYIIRYFTETKYYLKSIKQYIVQEFVTFVIQYAIFFMVIAAIDTHVNVDFSYRNKPTVIDSFYSRILYYLFFTNSLINCLFIIFAENKLRHQFTHLLTKHSMNMQALVIIKSVRVSVKIFGTSLLNVLLLCAFEKIFEPPFKLFPNPLQIGQDHFIVFIAGAIFLLSLSSVTYIVVELSSCNWHKIQILLVLSFVLSFMTEYFYKEDEISKVHFSFIYLSPFTTFSTILEELFRTKINYAKFRSVIPINKLFVISIIQMLILTSLAFALILKRIRKTDLKQLNKTGSKNRSNFQNQTLDGDLSIVNNSKKQSMSNLLLNAFIPSKISTYRGFQKKNVLQNVSFKGFRHEIISFIDYGNESKSALMKILVNDEKSDSYLQEDLKGYISYAPGTKLSFCSDKNIICEGLNPIEHLDIFLSLKNRSLNKQARIKEIKYMLDQFNITDEDSTKQIQCLSGGNQKKLCLACAFIGNPDVVILNEPTRGLDVRFKKIFWQRLKEWKEDKLIIVGTSDNEEAETISDRIWLINNGKLSDYLSYKTAKYFELNLEFYKKDHFTFCQNIVSKQFTEEEILKFQKCSEGTFNLKLQIYDMKNDKILSKTAKLIKQLNQQLKKSYHFYFKTFETKFTVDEFYKYKTILQKHFNNRPQEMVEEIKDIVLNEIMQSNQLKEFKIDGGENYYEKEIKRILMNLSKIQQNSHINLQQIKAIIYHKICQFKNEKLLLKEMAVVSLYFWVATINHESYGILDQQSKYIYARIIVVCSFLMVNFTFLTSTSGSSKDLLMQNGMNFRNIWLGEWIFNTFYIFSAFFVNLSINILYLLIFSEIHQQIYTVYLVLLLYIMNFTLLNLLLSVIVKRKEIITLILLLGIVIPTYLFYDIFLMKYPTQIHQLKEVLAFLVFPISLSSFYEHFYDENPRYYMIAVLMYEIIIPISILLVYERVTESSRLKRRPIILKNNIANDAIIEQQRLVEELFNDRDVVLGHNICKRYDNRSEHQSFLRNVYFHGKRGDILTFVGHNGCGKTTLFNILSGKIQAINGKVSILGKPQEKMSYLDKLQVGNCSQEGEVFNDFTVEQNIRFIGLMKGLKQQYLTKFTIKMLRYFKLYNKENALIQELSQGERKKVCIIINFLGFPSFMIFDQPTSSIDSESKAKVMYLIKHYSLLFKPIIFVTTHNILEAQQYSNRVVILKKGHLVNVGAPHELIKHPSQELYCLIVWFKYTENSTVLAWQQKAVKNFIREFTYIDIKKEEGQKFVYGLDLFKVDMLKVFVKMIGFSKGGVVDKFNLYKYDLEEVVKYNMATDESREFTNSLNKLKKQIVEGHGARLSA